MTTITRDDIQKLAGLSNLHLSDDEILSLQGDLKAVLQYVEQLDQLNTEDVQPAYQVTGLQNIVRDDTVAEDNVNRETLLALAPDTKDNQIKVPKVL